VGGELMHCQICLHEAPGHEPNCPVLQPGSQQGLFGQQSMAGGESMELFGQQYQLTQLPPSLTGSSWFIAQNASLKDLCRRAAEALEHESWVSEEQCGLPSQFSDLISELRKAAG